MSPIHTHRLPGNIGDSDCGNLYNMDDGDGDEDDQDDEDDEDDNDDADVDSHMIYVYM